MSKKLSEIFEELPEKEKDYITNEINQYLTNPMYSKQSVSDAINANTSLDINRKSVTKLMNYLGIPERDAEITKASKKYLGIAKVEQNTNQNYHDIRNRLLSQYSIDELTEKCASSPIIRIAKEFDVSPYYLAKTLESMNIPLRQTFTYKDVIEVLEQKGINKECITQYYLEKDHSFKEFAYFISDGFGQKVAESSIYRMLRYLGIIKPVDLIAYQQGKKSRRELLKNLEKLKKAGFDSREDLAQYYEDNLSLSKPRLVRQLNESLGEDFFTVRWLERHMDPLLSVDRLKGTSRVEREFAEILYLHLPKGTQVELNNNSIIAPLL